MQIVECLHGIDVAHSRCQLCGHPEDFISKPPRGAVHDAEGRRIPKPPKLIAVKDAKPDGITERAKAILMGEICPVCNTERFKGMCRCERFRAYVRNVEEIAQWATKLEDDHPDVAWAAVSGLRKAALQAGRDEPRPHGTGTRSLIAETMNSAFDRFEKSDKWRPPRNGKADDLPI